ncbi:hypothetical protein SASPL_136115 [Salvia splendens]|uniref:Uncharacterized protein n=1 Tax=Salvia splendens TaxID=180675 RepID=A0A8X8WZA7_SALSN|nr:hypothetical protein SASPL_136115 [Salvia splendens]
MGSCFRHFLFIKPQVISTGKNGFSSMVGVALILSISIRYFSAENLPCVELTPQQPHRLDDSSSIDPAALQHSLPPFRPALDAYPRSQLRSATRHN